MQGLVRVRGSWLPRLLAAAAFGLATSVLGCTPWYYGQPNLWEHEQLRSVHFFGTASPGRDMRALGRVAVTLAARPEAAGDQHVCNRLTEDALHRLLAQAADAGGNAVYDAESRGSRHWIARAACSRRRIRDRIHVTIALRGVAVFDPALPPPAAASPPTPEPVDEPASPVSPQAEGQSGAPVGESGRSLRASSSRRDLRYAPEPGTASSSWQPAIDACERFQERRGAACELVFIRPDELPRLKVTGPDGVASNDRLRSDLRDLVAIFCDVAALHGYHGRADVVTTLSGRTETRRCGT